MAETQQTMTEFTFAPGEKNIIGDRFSPSVIIFWLKTSIAASSTRIQYKSPNTLFGLIPLGADTKTIPLRNVASVDTSTKFNLGSLVWGVVFLLIGLGCLDSSVAVALVLILVAAANLANTMSASLVFHDPSGGANTITVSIHQQRAHPAADARQPAGPTVRPTHTAAGDHRHTDLRGMIPLPDIRSRQRPASVPPDTGRSSCSQPSTAYISRRSTGLNTRTTRMRHLRKEQSMTSKKLAAGMAAITMLATPAIGMIAAGTAMADPTTAATITVNGDLAGHTLTAYKIAVYGNVQITDGAARLTVSSTDKDKVAAAAKTAGIKVADGQDPVDAATRNATAAQVKAFAAALAKSGLAKAATVSGGLGATSVTLSDGITEGWYLVTDSKGLPVLVGTKATSNGQTATRMADGHPLGTIDIKSTSLSVDKKVNGSNDGSASVGSTITYTVTIPMPDPSNVKTLNYKDTLTGGVFADTPTATIDGKTVSISPQVDNANGSFTVDLTGLLAGNKDKTLVITYHVRTTAKTVTNDAELSGTDTDGNAIDPAHGGGSDTTSVKAYDFDLTKVDAVSTDTKLQGAQFKIQKKDGAWLKQTDGAWSDAKDETDATVFTTDAQGKTNFTGLGNGDYTVKEVTAPADHYLAGTFTFQATVKDGTTTFSGNNLVSAIDGNSAQVKNNPTVNGLAKTGQGGLLLAGTAAAAMAAIGAGCAIAYRRQKQAD